MVARASKSPQSHNSVTELKFDLDVDLETDIDVLETGAEHENELEPGSETGGSSQLTLRLPAGA